MSSSLSFITSTCIRRRILPLNRGRDGSAVAVFSSLINRCNSGTVMQGRSLQTLLPTNVNARPITEYQTTKNYQTMYPSEMHLTQRSTSPINCLKFLSTQAAPSTATDGEQIYAEPTMTQPSIIEGPDGRKFAAFEIPTFHRRLKPYIVKRRLARMKTFVGKEKNIRHSPWRMNLVCQFAAGQTLTDAIQQLDFCRKSKAPLVKKVLIRTANVADMKYGLQHSQLEVAECFATKGTPLKRIKIMGRGRAGRMEHKHAHFRVVLREIDFKLRIYQAPTIGLKKRWFLRQQQAEADFTRAKAERDEISRLEKETEAYRNKETK